MKDVFNSLGDEFRGFLDSLRNSFLGKKSHDYTASWGRESDFMSSSEDGFSVTGDKQVSLKQSCNHLAVISPSGGGKTTVSIIPTLLRQTRSSLIVIDGSREIRRKCARYLKSVGYEIRYLDFDVENFTTQIAFYNPLSRCHSKADIAKLVSILTKTASSENGNDKFWTIQAGEVISLAIERVKRDPDTRTHHLASVFYYIQLMIAEEDRISFDIAQFDDLFMRWKVILANSSNTKASIFSSAIASLSWIDTNPNLVLLTSKDTTYFTEMRKKKIAIFISIPLAYEDVYAPLLNCFYAQFFSSILESPLPEETDYPILCLLDEFGSSMHVPNFNKYISNLRKWMVGCLLVLQSESQLDKYGKAQAKELLNSCTKIYFTGLDDEAERISRMLGKYSYRDDKDQQRERLLLSPEEIRTMPSDRCIVVPNGGLKPMYTKLNPYYKQRKLVKRSEMKSSNENEELVYPELRLILINELPEDLRE